MRAAGAMRHIEHLAGLRLAPHVAIPEMLRALDGLVPGARASFYWVDASGAVLDAYVPGAVTPPVPVMEPGGLLRADGEGGVQLTLKAGDQVRAVLSLRRECRGARVSERERQLLRATAASFRRALEAQPGPDEQFDEVPEQTGLLVAGGDGRLVSADAAALQLVREMDGRPLVAVGPPPAPGESLAPFIADLVRGGARRHASILQRTSRWGAYRAQAFPQLGEGAASVIMITKHLPRPVRLMRTLETLDLSPRERQVAFQLGMGADVDAEACAAKLGVAVTTWRSYVKRIYQRLEVRDRVDLFARLNLRPVTIRPAAG